MDSTPQRHSRSLAVEQPPSAPDVDAAGVHGELGEKFRGVGNKARRTRKGSVLHNNAGTRTSIGLHQADSANFSPAARG